jgi:hypothetical protein
VIQIDAALMDFSTFRRLGLTRGPGMSITRQACPSSGSFLAQARVHAFQPECPLLFGGDPTGKRTLRSWRLRSSIPFQRWRRPWISQTLDFTDPGFHRPWISSALAPGGYECVMCGYARVVTPICAPAAKTPAASLVGPLGTTSKTCESFAEYRIRLPLPLHPPKYLPASHRTKARCMPKRYLEVSSYLRR